MTIALVYKYDDKAIFINDFRVTTPGKDGNKQLDALNKFRQVNDNIGMFLAGNVEYWKLALNAIGNNKDQITIDNILNIEGPLKTSLQACLERIPCQSNEIIGAIGCLVDPDTKKNVVFKIKGKPGFGCIIEEVPDDSCIVIGSGSSIPGIQTMMYDKGANLVKNNKLNLSLMEIATGMRNELKMIFKQCGSSSFRKLGISPIFSISLLESSSFYMCGEEIKGSFHSSTSEKSRSFHYIFEKQDGVPILFDFDSKKKIPIKDIYDFSPESPSNIFDPERLTEGFDPSDCIGQSNDMYIINQWVDVSMNSLIDYNKLNKVDNLYFVDRTIYKVKHFIYKGQILCNPTYEVLAQEYIEDITELEAAKYNNVGKHHLILKGAFEEKVFEKLVKLNISNHQWLRELVCNYDDLYRL
ncbi:hypothetical protein CN510_16145 [Priestia megaterium]|uniref:hypothetical protein n=1 Tax=Priestia megaterium TaxID=1404 RepID=UPI000BF7F0BA|nr:hypothetical protein [Priestia megaterium]PES95293.1 hypothetical protein CN510_16145 [Priestia megaterium]